MTGKVFLFLLCLNVVSFAVIASNPQSCPADDVSSKFGDSDEWQGEFFSGITKIKYEGPLSNNPLSFKWYNADEEILGDELRRDCRIRLILPRSPC